MLTIEGVWGGERTSCSKGTGADDEVGPSTADEAHHIVGRLQVVPEADILMIEDVVRPANSIEDLHALHVHQYSKQH